MAAKHRIVVIGSANQALILPMSKIPAGGTAVTEQFFAYVPGGGGINSALVFARLGGDPVLCARIAGDANGRYLTDFMRRNGIDTRFVNAEDRSKTGLEAVIVTETEPNRTVIYPGANLALTAGDTEFAMTCLPDALFVNLDMPVSPVVRAVRTAKERRVPVFVNAGRPAPDFPLEAIDNIKIFIADQKSVFDYTGCAEIKQSTYVSVCMALANRVTAENYVIKLSNGSTLAYDNTFYKLHIPPCEAEVIDPATASDAFAASLAHYYLRSGDLHRSCRFANIVETATLSGSGASASIPTKEKIREFIKNNEIDFDYDPD